MLFAKSYRLDMRRAFFQPVQHWCAVRKEYHKDAAVCPRCCGIPHISPPLCAHSAGRAEKYLVFHFAGSSVISDYLCGIRGCFLYVFYAYCPIYFTIYYPDGNLLRHAMGCFGTIRQIRGESQRKRAAKNVEYL